MTNSIFPVTCDSHHQCCSFNVVFEEIFTDDEQASCQNNGSVRRRKPILISRGSILLALPTSVAQCLLAKSLESTLQALCLRSLERELHRTLDLADLFRHMECRLVDTSTFYDLTMTAILFASFQASLWEEWEWTW